MKQIRKLNADTEVKNYWRDNRRFADLLNVTCFNGKEYINADKLKDIDTDESLTYIFDTKAEDMSRIRDIFKEYDNGTGFILTGIENQSEIHYAMPVRTMLYDALRYAKQCKELEELHRKNRELKNSAEFLSGLKPTDRIKPVVTVVLYYGKENWDGARSLLDMVDIPQFMNGLTNDYKLHLVQIRDFNASMFKNTDNRHLFTLMNEYYNNEKLDVSRLYKKYGHMDICWETLAAFAGLVGAEDMLQQAITKKGERIDMWEAFETFKKEAKEQGINKGRLEQKNEIIISMLDNGIEEMAAAKIAKVDISYVLALKNNRRDGKHFEA